MNGSSIDSLVMPKLTSVLVLFALTMLNACGNPVETPVDRAVQELPRLQHQGDLDVIREHGVLRLLLERQTDSYLPRFGDALFSERQLAQRFGERLGLKVEVVYVDRFTDLLPALIAGRGDLVAANLSVTPERQSKVEFTDPIGSSQDTLVFAAVTQPPTDNAALVGSVAAREGTTLLQTAYQLAEQHQALQVVSVSPNVANEALFDQLVDGEVDLLVQDSNVLATALAYRSDIRAGSVVGEPLPLAWAVRPDANLLLAALNDYLREYRLLGEAHLRYVADVDEIRDRGRLRMICLLYTSPSPRD